MEGSTHMKNLFRQTFTVSTGYAASFLTFMFSLFITTQAYEAYFIANRQWEANWDGLYNPSEETLADIQEMQNLGIDLYAHAEKLKPSVFSLDFFIDSLPYAAMAAMSYVAVWLIYLHIVDRMNQRYRAKVSL